MRAARALLVVTLWATAAGAPLLGCQTTAASRETPERETQKPKKKKKRQAQAPVEAPIDEAPETPELSQTEAPPSGERVGLETGKASFYADMLKGNRTANGERYNPEARTCAHPSHPFGTRLKITANGKSVECRVNDRGPFVKGRIVDVSKALARELGMVKLGVIEVEVEVVPGEGS
jgi:rare lipoprotein A